MDLITNHREEIVAQLLHDRKLAVSQIQYHKRQLDYWTNVKENSDEHLKNFGIS